MQYTLKTRLLALLLAIVLVLGVPMTAFATEAGTEATGETQPVADETEAPAQEDEAAAAVDETYQPSAEDFTSPEIVYTPRDDDYYNLISKKDYNLAPGITESEIVLNNDAGSHRQVAHVVEVNINNPYTKVIPSSKGMVPTPGKYGVEIMSKQAAYAEANGYGNVVAAMNIALSWYDSAYYKAHPELVGEPLGYLVLDGVMYANSQGQTSGAQTCLVINFDEKDGKARPADMPKTEIRSTSTAITGWEEQVIPANFGFLVKDGVNQNSENHTSDPASRSFMGIKEDGSIIIVMNDGRQSPYSAGFNSYEMAEFMLSLGCVQAVNGDGGGSSAFLSQRPGEELALNSAPSDGAERETTHGILVISTAPATGEFVRASISSAEDYYTPGSSVQFSAIGSDLVGTAAEIPAEATWQLADASYGTIENGLFVSNGTQGAVTVQMVYNGAVVGEDTIHIVMPDSIAFGQANMVVPYGKTVTLDLVATYDSKPVVLKASDVTFTLSEAGIGSISGFEFTAAEEGVAVTAATLTAAVGEETATAALSLGKGSDIIYDFEDQDITGWSIFTNYGKYGPKGPNGKVTDDNGNYWYHGQNERGYINIVDATTGKVRNGDYALAVECDFTQIFETGYQALNLMFPTIDTTDALSVGFWLYVPYDARHAQLGIAAGGFDNGELFLLNEGWHYVSATPNTNNAFYYVNISVDDRACSSTGAYYDYITEANLNGKYTFYIDDITVDYSTAVEDRENPVFDEPKVLSVTGETSAVLTGQTVDYNTVTFEAAVAENTTKSNAVGLDASTAKAYIDGKAVECTYTGGKISIPGVVLADGIHTVKFEIADKNGNSAWVGGDINVQAGTDASTVKVVPQDPEADRILIGSLYWMDVIATDIETVDKVEMVFDLNNASSWELEGLTVAEGFSAEWSVQKDDNIAAITITRTGENKATGEAVLASFPVRTWVSTTTQYEGYEHMDPAWLVDYGCIWKKNVELDLQYGAITYVADYESTTTGTFGMEDLDLETEVFFTNYTRGSVAGAQAQKDAWIAAGTGWHEHTVEAVDDKDATCSENGYTGRTYCAVCDSIVDWGTVVVSDGHDFTGEDGLNVCGTCGVAYYYIGGVAQIGWINADGKDYYCDEFGNAVTGEATVDGHTYLFVDYVLTEGAWEHDGVGLTCWWAGKLINGPTYDTHWKTINGKTYYFNNIYANVGVAKVQTSQTGATWYNLFDENGVFMKDFVGIHEDYYFDHGVMVKAYRLVKWEGDFYFINDGHKIAKSTKLYIGDKYVAGITLSDGTAFPAGLYYFDADGKITNPPAVVDKSMNGIIGDYYYIEGIKQTKYRLFEYEGSYYFINDGDKIARNTRLYLSDQFVTGITLSDGTAFPAGLYYFDADGKITNPPAVIDTSKNGIIGDYFFNQGVMVKAYRLVEWEGDFYFINDYSKIAKNTKLYLGEQFVEGHTFANGDAVKPGIYEFDAEGKMVVLNGPIGDYFYVNGIKQIRYELFEYKGDHYFVNDGSKLARNAKIYLNESFVDGHTYPNGEPMQPGYYEFDEEGKMVILNGIMGDYYYVNGVLQKAWKLIIVDGNYYFINDYNKLAKNTKLYLSEKFVAGFAYPNGDAMQPGIYQFDADGKMIILNGMVGDYYYINGVIQKAWQLIEYEGNFYFINDYDKIAKNTKLYLSEKFVDGFVKENGEPLKPGLYHFDKDGKMIFA